MLFTMHFFESRAYERSAPPPAAVNFHVIFFLCIWWQDSEADNDITIFSFATCTLAFASNCKHRTRLKLVISPGTGFTNNIINNTYNSM